MNTAIQESKTSRRSILATSAVASAVGLSLVTSGTANAKPANEASVIRPFTYHAPQAALDDLHRRITAVQWPEKETVADASQGVQLATMKDLATYWANKYDWRKCEARLDALPQFITTIDGLDIHFIHVRSKHKNALPIIVTHGWPGSIVEQMKLVGPLTDPTKFGGKAEDAFDVVIPSMPGYGFSGKPTVPGWDCIHMARAWAVLMERLGYTKYVAQGGDWGSLVVEQMGVQAPPGLLGIHCNLPGCVPADVDKAAWSGAPAPAGLSDEEKIAYDRLVFLYTKGVSYAFQLGLRPQTMYGLADSPLGLAAYLLDHDARSYASITRTFAGQPGFGLTRDDILDNITLTWLTNTGVSSGRLYWENKLSFLGVKGVTVPVAVTAFPDEVYPAPRSWAEKAFPNLIHYNKANQGGHFAAWEQPQILSEELRASFKSLR